MKSEEKLTVCTTLRQTPSGRKKAEAEAARAGMSYAEYCRSMVEKGEVRILRPDPLRFDHLCEIQSRLGELEKHLRWHMNSYCVGEDRTVKAQREELLSFCAEIHQMNRDLTEFGKEALQMPDDGVS